MQSEWNLYHCHDPECAAGAQAGQRRFDFVNALVGVEPPSWLTPQPHKLHRVGTARQSPLFLSVARCLNLAVPVRESKAPSLVPRPAARVELRVFLPKEGIAPPLGRDAAAEIAPDEPSVAASADPADHPQNLYRFPALYDALKTPTPADVAVVRALIEHNVGPGPWAILDPASGPGNWLRPFCDGHNRLFGNDFSLPMVRYVEQTLGPCGCRVQHGDMYDLRISESFDVVLEVSGVTSIVPDVPTLGRVIDHWARRLRPGGLLLLLVNFQDLLPPQLPAVTWQVQGVPLAAGGTAGVCYELVEDRPHNGTQWIRRTVTTQGAPGLPPYLCEEYALRVWSPDEVLAAAALAQNARLDAVVHPDNAFDHVCGMTGERYLVFRPAG